MRCKAQPISKQEALVVIINTSRDIYIAMGNGDGKNLLKSARNRPCVVQS